MSQYRERERPGEVSSLNDQSCKSNPVAIALGTDFIYLGHPHQFTYEVFRSSISTPVIAYSQHARGLTFTVRVVTRAARSEIAGEHNGALRVRVTASPVKGAANRELARVLAMNFKLSQNAVEIISGLNSKSKVVRILGADAARLEQLIAAK